MTLPFRRGKCQCNPVPLTWDKKHATYYDPCGVLRCRGCQEPVYIRTIDEIDDLYGGCA